MSVMHSVKKVSRVLELCEAGLHPCSGGQFPNFTFWRNTKQLAPHQSPPPPPVCSLKNVRHDSLGA